MKTQTHTTKLTEIMINKILATAASVRTQNQSESLIQWIYNMPLGTKDQKSTLVIVSKFMTGVLLPQSPT